MCLSTTQTLGIGTLIATENQKSSILQKFTCIVVLARPFLPLNLQALEHLWEHVGIMRREFVILPLPMPP